MKKKAKKYSPLVDLYILKSLSTLKFPSISRFIPDAFIKSASKTVLNRIFFLNFLTGVVIMIVIIQGLTTVHTWVKYQSMMERQHHLEETISYWETVVKKYPNYRDGYFRLAALSYQVGKDIEAKEYMKKVFDLDPNFSEGKELVNRLSLIK